MIDVSNKSCDLYMAKNMGVIEKDSLSKVVQVIDITNLTICSIFVFLNMFVVAVYANMPQRLKQKTSNFTLFIHAFVSVSVTIYKILQVVFWYDSFISSDKWLLHQILYIFERYIILINVGSFLLFSGNHFISIHWQQFRTKYPTRKYVAIATASIWFISLIPSVLRIICIRRCHGNVTLYMYFAETIIAVVAVGTSYVMLFMSYSTITKILRSSRDQHTIEENKKLLEYFKLYLVIISYFCLTYIPIPVYKMLFPVEEGQLHFKLFKEYARYFSVITTGTNCKNPNYGFGLWDIVCTFLFTSSPIFNAILTLFQKDDYTDGLYKVLKRSEERTTSLTAIELATTHTQRESNDA